MLAHEPCTAIDAHDIDAFVACFDDEYDSAQPAHPGRELHGSEQVRRNWTAVFSGVPDIRAELLTATEDGGVEWAEWHRNGTRTDGSAFDVRGVTVAGTRNGRLGWMRLYMEEVAQTAEGIDATVRQLTHS